MPLSDRCADLGWEGEESHTTKGETMTQEHPPTTTAASEDVPGSEVIQRVAAALEATETGQAAAITRVDEGAEPPLPARRR